MYRRSFCAHVQPSRTHTPSHCALIFICVSALIHSNVTPLLDHSPSPVSIWCSRSPAAPPPHTTCQAGSASAAPALAPAWQPPPPLPNQSREADPLTALPARRTPAARGPSCTHGCPQQTTRSQEGRQAGGQGTTAGRQAGRRAGQTGRQAGRQAVNMRMEERSWEEYLDQKKARVGKDMWGEGGGDRNG